MRVVVSQQQFHHKKYYQNVSTEKRTTKGEDDGKRNSGTGDCVHGGVCRSETGMREQPGYRETVQWLTEQAGGKGWLKTSDVAKLLGLDRDTVVRRFGIRRGCAIPVLAQKLCEESK